MWAFRMNKGLWDKQIPGIKPGRNPSSPHINRAKKCQGKGDSNHKPRRHKESPDNYLLLLTFSNAYAGYQLVPNSRRMSSVLRKEG